MGGGTAGGGGLGGGEGSMSFTTEALRVWMPRKLVKRSFRSTAEECRRIPVGGAATASGQDEGLPAFGRSRPAPRPVVPPSPPLLPLASAMDDHSLRELYARSGSFGRKVKGVSSDTAGIASSSM